MSRTGQIATVIAAALLGLAVGYLAMTSLADDEVYPVDPIELNPGSTNPDTPPSTVPTGETIETVPSPTPTTLIEDDGDTGGTDGGDDDDDDDGGGDNDDGDD